MKKSYSQHKRIRDTVKRLQMNRKNWVHDSLTDHHRWLDAYKFSMTTNGDPFVQIPESE